MPNLKYLDPAGFDAVGNQVVAMHDELADARRGFAPQLRIRCQRLGFGANCLWASLRAASGLSIEMKSIMSDKSDRARRDQCVCSSGAMTSKPLVDLILRGEIAIVRRGDGFLQIDQLRHPPCDVMPQRILRN